MQLEQQLQKIRSENRLGLMTHIVVGYPDVAENMRLIKVMADSGVDFIELQIPFSDPVADGPTLMAANQQSLEQGTTVEACFELMRSASRAVTIPLLFMTYFNIVHRYGVEAFCRDAASAGCAGLIVPDIPLDEEAQEHFIELAKKYGLVPIRLLSPASTEDRIIKNAALGHDGFVYFVSRKGTTGAHETLPETLVADLARLRKHFSIPIAVGFGISKPEHVAALRGKAEIAVIGSEVVNVYKKAEQGKGIDAVKEFLDDIVAAL